MNPNRDYDSEIQNTVDHQYAYGFDFDVMHPFMLRSFEPFFRPGKLLELLTGGRSDVRDSDQARQVACGPRTAATSLA